MFAEAQELAGTTLDCDVAIVGAGAAGITLAAALDNGRRRIVLVEGGGFDIEPAAQALFDARSIGAPVAAEEGRYRVFGGTTVAWTGRCAPLDPLDFAARDWVPDSGWPIDAAEMAAFYPRAAAMCGFESGWDTSPPAFDAIAALPDRPPALAPFAWRFWSTAPDNFQHWGQRFYQDFRASQTLRVVLNANLVELEASGDGGAVAAARLRSPCGETFRLRADRFVLCCGGIENARLLLNFAEDTPALFGTVAPVLGRYFMQHPRAATADIVADANQSLGLQALFNRFRRNHGLQFETGLVLSEAAQAEERLLNASAVLRYQQYAALRLDRALTSAVRRLRGHEPLLGASVATLVVDLEQVPDRDSRILLAEQRDAIGLRKAVLDWRVSEAERRSSLRFTKAICAWIEQLGLGRAILYEGVEEHGGLLPEWLRESYHHLGATRMAADPNRGVVDANLRVHGTRNLHVCGGSVMPTGGHANPTLTIVALALRLADEIARADQVEHFGTALT